MPLMLMLKLAAVQLTNRWVAREQIRTVRSGRRSPSLNLHESGAATAARNVPFNVLASTDAEAAKASVRAELSVVPDGTAAAEKVS